ncbi:ferredoxin Fer [Natronolimnohabitans innermongolicus]|uniref:UspA domain-containing protein n=1 Tax=Natronolimnohabitans innermongolicus JCM 12255 TaxID=1227499 RepID=L9XAP5_9EURY|nr:ferredoxin Fer [Natronolimnohabitans innermongolicus]ELY58707.1 UspA domain-containing protein [Natronolimnohabitans innermongolicus JCM 12255]
MYETILVPTDGSAVADRAGEYALELADGFDATVHALHVTEGGGLLGGDDGDGEQAVEDLAERADGQGIDVTTSVRDPEDAIHSELLEYADEHDVDLVVMGTHGRSGLDRFLLGSVAQQTLRESSVPVATVHDETALEREFDRLLVPIDGSHSAATALEHAIDLATETDGRLHLVHVSDEAPLEDETVTYGASDTDEETVGLEPVDDALERVRDSKLASVDVSTPSGRVDQQILAVAAEHDVDGIVMGTHGETGLRRYLLGSTTERVVRFADVPVIGLSAPRTKPVTVEYLDYRVVDERGWSIDDDPFERADAADLEADAYGTFEAGREEYVLDAAESAGLNWPFHCRAGGCVNCAAVVLEGDLEMDVQRSLSDEEVEEEDLRLTCVATPASDSLRLVYNAKHLDRLQDRVI